MHTSFALQQPSSLKTPTAPRKPPLQQLYQSDQLEDFAKKDEIESFNELSEKNYRPGFQFYRTVNTIIYYKIIFDEKSRFPWILEAIKVDSELHVELQYKNNCVPLPKWFTQGRNAKLTSLSMLHKFHSYLCNLESKADDFLLELSNRQHYLPNEQPPYSCEMMRFALLLRYTSGRAYKIFLVNCICHLCSY